MAAGAARPSCCASQGLVWRPEWPPGWQALREVPHPALPSCPINSLLTSLGRWAARREGLPWRGQRSLRPGAAAYRPLSLGQGGPAALGVPPRDHRPVSRGRARPPPRLQGPTASGAQPSAACACGVPHTPRSRPGGPQRPQPLCHSPEGGCGQAVLTPCVREQRNCHPDAPSGVGRTRDLSPWSLCRDAHTHDGRRLVIPIMGSLRRLPRRQGLWGRPELRPPPGHRAQRLLFSGK